MTDRRRFHPFRTRPLTGAEVGWFRPAAAIVLALILPAALALAMILLGAPTVDAPPRDGGYAFGDHVGLVIGALSASFLVSWMAAPLALLALRAAAMLGWAGWGTAVLAALALGLPITHVALNGDVTTEGDAILAHMAAAIAILGWSVWAAFWTLMALRRNKTTGGSADNL